MIGPQHLDALAASGITPEHARARGYETITDRRRLAEIGITAAGRNVPGLLVPLLRADGSTWGYQYRPDAPRLRDGRPVKYETPYRQRNGLDVPPGAGPMLADPAVPLWITEGAKKSDAGVAHGLCVVSLSGVWNWLGRNSAGGKMALPDWHDVALNGRRVIIAFDGDVARKEPVQRAARALAAYLSTKGARVEYLHLPDTDDKTGLDDYLVGHSVEELMQLVRPVQPVPHQAPRPQAEEAEPKPQRPQPVSLAEVHAGYREAFGDGYDLGAVDMALAVAAVEKLAGDPVWLLIVSGSGAAKTETIMPLGGCDGAVVVSTVSSEGAFLSATSSRERTTEATGGLLREMGPRGLLVLKDFTSVLAMQRERRNDVLKALREIYDGYWRRQVGTDGGYSLEWQGRIVLIGAVTSAYDRAREVIAKLGDRFVLLRVDSNKKEARLQAARSAVRSVGAEERMRAELARLVSGLVANIDPGAAAEPDSAELDAIVAAADLVTRARSAVDRSPGGEVEEAHMLEMPTRFPKQLVQIFRGATAIGLDRAAAMGLVIRAARDSVPPSKLEIIDWLAGDPGQGPRSGTANDVAIGIDKPFTSTDRHIKELHLLGVVTRAKVAERWHYRLAAGISPAVLASPGLSPPRAETVAEVPVSPPDYWGAGGGGTNLVTRSEPTCGGCGETLDRPESIAAGLCSECRLAAGEAV